MDAPVKLCVFAALLIPVVYGLPSSQRVTQISSFVWKNCAGPYAPAVMKSLTVSPDPISIPGDLTASASGSTTLELTAPLSVNVTLEREVAGFWVRIPCVEDLGSCHYQDMCDLLDQLIPPGQDCPEPLHSYGLPCHCPFKKGSYSLPQSQFYLPDMDLPYWLTNGNYRVQGVLEALGKELGCLQVGVSIHSDASTSDIHTGMVRPSLVEV